MAAGELLNSNSSGDEFTDDGVLVSPSASRHNIALADEQETLARRVSILSKLIDSFSDIQTHQRSLATRSPLISRLAAGLEEVVSEEGTSQYALGGLSACGIAALNATRLVLCHETDLPPVRGRGIQLLKDIATPEALRVRDILLRFHSERRN